MSGMNGTVLCIVHHGADDVGLCGPLLEATGHRLDIRQPLVGDALPPPEKVRHALIFGGTMSSNDEHLPGIAAELSWIRAAVAGETKLFGTCLGGQLISRAMGGTVAHHSEGLWEVGYRELASADKAGVFFGDDPPPAFFQWHQEGFTLPAGTERLAAGDIYPEQAFHYRGRVFATQFHPEVGATQMRSWHKSYPDALAVPGGDPVPKQLEDDAQYRPAVEAWLARFLRRWAAAGSW